jgi:hypothetical protein
LQNRRCSGESDSIASLNSLGVGIHGLEHE